MSVTRRNFIQAAGVAPLMAQSDGRVAANDRIQVGFIGTGARAQELMQAAMANPGNEIVGIVDAYKGRTARALERTGGRAKIYANHHDLLAQNSIDAVFIATPDHWHRPMALDAIAAGKDVYCEKPLTYRTSDGPEIIRAASEKHRILQVGSQGISSPIQQKAKEIIKRGSLGQITTVRASYNRNTASGAWIYPIPPDASPKTVNWDMFLGPAPKRPFSLERFFRWRCYQDYSGGLPTDLFVHVCTTLHYLLDAKAPAKAIALGELYRWKSSHEVPDTVNAILEYREGFVVNLSATFNSQSAAESGIQILGTRGSLSLGDGLSFRPEKAMEDNRWIVDSWPSELEKRYYEDPKVRLEEVPSAHNPTTLVAAEYYRQVGPDATVLHIGRFLESVRTRKQPVEDAAAGHHAAACAHLINESVRRQGLVEWDFAKDDIKA